MTERDLDEQRRKARRMGLGLLVVVLAIYAGFILLSMHKGHA